jgi:prolipoprotein diacylglyceryl transferase
VPVVAQIPPPPFSVFELGPLSIHLYGILIATGAYLALRMATTRYERLGGDPDVAERTALWILGAGFLGARIGYVLPRLTSGGPGGEGFLADPLAILAIWQGGLALFGGLFAGTLVGVVLMRRWKGDIPAFADAVAPAVPLAQAIGRWGNYFNQELYGRPTDVPWALEVEPGFRRPGFEDVATFHPTFLYESLANVVLVIVLLRVDKLQRLRRGSLLWLYAIGYGVIRAATEWLRVDTAERYVGLSRNNWIAIAVVLVGIAGLRWWQSRGPTDEDLVGASDEDPDADPVPDTADVPADTDTRTGDQADSATQVDTRSDSGADAPDAGVGERGDAGRD